MTAPSFDPALQESVQLLAASRRSGRRITALPPASRPSNAQQAHDIQDAVTQALGAAVGGWKVAVDADGSVLRGAMFSSRIVPSPARVASSAVPLLGVEVEVAFLFNCDLPRRAEPYGEDELAGMVTALPAIEIVDTRYADYHAAPKLDRIADHSSFGMLVRGRPEPRWRSLGLDRALARIWADGEELGAGTGNLKSGNPLLPALALANSLRADGRIKAGHIVTTGTYTPLRFARPGQRITASIQGLGEVSVDTLAE